MIQPGRDQNDLSKMQKIGQKHDIEASNPLALASQEASPSSTQYDYLTHQK